MERDANLIPMRHKARPLATGDPRRVGDILHASDAQNPDLFWGLRGAGGNFGIVTEFEFQLHPASAAALVADLFYRRRRLPRQCADGAT